MTAGEFAQILTAIGVLGGVAVSWRNGRKTDRVADKVEEVHRSTNGKMDQLLAVTGASEKAKGVMEGLQQAADKAAST